MWVGSVRLPPGKGLEAKLVLMDGSHSGRWEPGGNRAFTLAAPIRAAEVAVAEEEEEEQEEEQEGAEFSEGSSGLAHGWQDPGSCIEEVADLEAEESETTVSAAAAAAVMPGSVVDAASGPDVALVLHWGLAVYSQVMPIPSRRPARPSSPAPPPGSSPVDEAAVAQCSFVVPHFPTCPGQHLMLVGSAPELGGWNAGEALKLTWQPGHAWVGEAQLPNTGKLEAKVGGVWGAWVHGAWEYGCMGAWVVIEGSMVTRSLGGDGRVHESGEA